ncbi:MAG: S-layer family protein [Microcoleus sp. PH2017_10_PVI_O_A]|uniref:beta strand repeat-containing protein n=1 Tax=unclassified Microcoleus TaxID=2642155 RepID=UPI001D741C4B|nr:MULTISPECIES: S-layer family protein [unclassified Microcoleus]TAE77263.1 MAG: S-layer family protein [Oscillatoriales cyanobacterium]MCC3409113.1 S-layer family protein [Microcoleus sp. PH2017_10_PVI_O_A]MCC3463249.1 S-layer family protein [Microcoleus sp. PH2017_11_PCY_U_A]MCC3481670.1 S-layer family protein [Microcoleus sp. PH2017_12_PCY_D_A]MCC3562587.1 S-layer family protein [Microcoleus sp. PH2017_27_LUM_O_A]
MNKSPFPFQLLTALAFCYLTAPPTLAQIVPDTTLPINSTVTNNDNTDIIDGGTKAGNNLFHSFREFSVPTGGTAFFNNSLDVQNIITRVTGSSISNIDGLLQANGNANLFLLNPNGIIFGENARLSIGGSFLASTADSLIFADGTQFSAKNPQTTPLLTISVPIGLQLGTANPIIVRGPGQNLIPDEETGAIVREDNNVVGLAVEPGRSLVLAGADIQLQGGNLTAPAGRISLLAVRNGEARTPNNESLFTSDILPQPASSLGNIEMSQKATVDASGTRGGDIQLAGRNIRLTEGSAVLSLTREAEPGGNLSVTAAEAIEIIGSPDGQRSGFLAETIGEGNGGNLQISARNLLLRDGGQATTSTFGDGRGGNVRVDVSEFIEATGTTPDGEPGGLFAQTESAGAAGNLTINTGRLFISDGALVSTTALGSGNAGSLTINALESVEVIGIDTPGDPPLSALSSSTEGEGAGGDLTIDTKRLILRDGAQVFTNTSGAGQAGDLQVNASESIVISGGNEQRSGILTQVESIAMGDGGNLTVATRQLIVRDGAQIGSGTRSAGKSGNITVTVKDSVELAGTSISRFPSGIFTQVDEENATGNGGNVTVNTRQLRVLDGAQISAGTRGIGSGGDVTIKASESVQLSGVSGTVDPETNNPFTSGLFARTRGSGNAGGVNIFTDRLTVQNGAEAAVDARFGGGDAGNLEIRSREIRLLNGGVLTAETAVGEGGNIRINASAIQMRDRSRISTTAGTSDKPGNGGNINIKTDTLAGVRNSDISANAFEGLGGRIAIDAQAVLGFQTPSRQDLETQLGNNLTQFDPQDLPSSDITAISRTNPNLSGTVEINTPDIDPSSGLIALPQPGVTAIIQNPCNRGSRSSFVNVGRGGVRPTPREIVSNSGANSGDNLETELVEAQGWERDADGTIRLVARSRNVIPYSNWQNPVKCDR